MNGLLHAPLKPRTKVRVLSPRPDLRDATGVVLERHGIEYTVKLDDGRTIHCNDTQVEPR